MENVKVVMPQFFIANTPVFVTIHTQTNHLANQDEKLIQARVQINHEQSSQTIQFGFMFSHSPISNCSELPALKTWEELFCSTHFSNGFLKMIYQDYPLSLPWILSLCHQILLTHSVQDTVMPAYKNQTWNTKMQGL